MREHRRAVLDFRHRKHFSFRMQELYGHKCLMFNVGAMMPWMNFTPRTLDQIIGGASNDNPKREAVS